MDDSSAAPSVALLAAREELTARFAGDIEPLLTRLGAEMDHRLVRSVREALIAILVHPRPRQALMLTTSAEQSPHRPRLIHPVKRVYRLLHHSSFSPQTVNRWRLDRGRRGWDPLADELVLVDGSALIKPYGVRMEHPARVPNPLTGPGGPKTMPGDFLLAAVRTTLAKGMAQMLCWQLWSTRTPGFRSEKRVTEQFLDRLLARVGRQGVLVMDRGFGCFAPLGRLAAQRGRFVVRLTAKRHFGVDDEGVVHLALLADRLPLVYERVVYDPLQKQEVLVRVELMLWVNDHLARERRADRVELQLLTESLPLALAKKATPERRARWRTRASNLRRDNFTWEQAGHVLGERYFGGQSAFFPDARAHFTDLASQLDDLIARWNTGRSTDPINPVALRHEAAPQVEPLIRQLVAEARHRALAFLGERSGEFRIPRLVAYAEQVEGLA